MGSGYERPGRGTYVNAPVAGKTGDVIYANGYVGSTIKQKAVAIDTPKINRDDVAIGERVFLRTAGVCEVPDTALAGVAVGDMVYISTDGLNTLSHAGAGAGRVPLGRVHAVAGIHGCPVGTVRVNMDQKV